MATPFWQPGTIYPPGSLVQPVSQPPPVPDQVTNGDFEAGNTGWTLASGFSIGQFGNGTHFDGTWSLQYDPSPNAEARAINNNATEVAPGQIINASCQVQQGASDAGDAGARVEVLWYDSSDEFISATPGNLVSSTSNQNWKQSSVAATAPANAAFARFSVSAFRTQGGDELWIDACSWDAVISGLPNGLVFRAVQASAGHSGSSEPVWPLVNGQTVVDFEVTWEAVFASRVVWEASPILVSGEYEPNWPTVPDGTVADGTILWTAMNWRVTQAPHSKVVVIGASKIFAADEDIIAFSATVNPLDWTTPEDAGYIPFGLNTFGSTPVTAMGLYRSNLVAFNSEAYQMWQIDEDPANMAILDASPVACLFHKSVQPVSNDLVMCTPEGVRNIGIAGASTNLQAGYFGAQVDPLVLAKIRAGLVPFALFWPSMGQYWLIFENGTAGSEAFVLTMNGGAKDQSWSRYLFPETLTDWAILGGDLYLRTDDLVWRVDPALVLDDGREGVPGDPYFDDVGLIVHFDGTNGSTSFPDSSDNAFTVSSFNGAALSTSEKKFGTASLSTNGSSSFAGMFCAEDGPLDLGGGDFTVEGWFYLNTIAGVQVIFGFQDVDFSPLFRLYNNGGGITIQAQIFPGAHTWSDIASTVFVVANTWYHFAVVRAGTVGYVFIDGVGTDNHLSGDPWDGTPPWPLALSFGVSSNLVGFNGSYLDGYIDEVRITKGVARYTSDFTPPTAPFPDVTDETVVGDAFEGYISWPYLDFGILGIDKMLEGFDVVADGTFRVSFGYSQRDFSLATPDYALDGDTVTGSMVPMPLTAPSFQMRITFDSDQSWEWFASTLYINNEGTG